MARTEPTFFLLDKRTGRRTGATDGVSVDPATGLILSAEVGGALGLGSTDGSFGGLRLPVSLALDSNCLVYLLTGSKVLRFHPASRSFHPLVGVGGPRGSEPRRFDSPAGIAIDGDNLYVADSGNARVQVFDLRTLALVHLWTAPGGGIWQPVAVASANGSAYVLDRKNGRVYWHRAGSEPLERLVDDADCAGSYSGLAVDVAGRIYLLDRSGPVPTGRVFDPAGAFVETITDAGQVRSRFAQPSLEADHKGRFCLPSSLVINCDRQLPAIPLAPHDPLATCRERESTSLLFDRHGRSSQFNPEAPPGPPIFTRRGIWWSEALDSEIHRCQWHRIVLRLTALPPGARATVSTLTSGTKLAPNDLANTDENRWLTRFVAVGALQPPPSPLAVSAAPGIDKEFLIQSRQGRYLWLRIELLGDGFSSPALDRIKVEFPRRSGLDFLPAVYSTEEESRWFLERFLAICQTEWDSIGESVDTIRRLFDPEAVPDGFVEYLASWLELPLEGAWDDEQKRRMLTAAPGYYPKRGTLEALRTVLQVYLWNMTGVEPQAQGEIPAVAEGFRARQRLMLAADHPARLGPGAPLWSLSLVGRLQLGVFAREGEVRLVSTDDPQRDLFYEHAHRFQVFVPAGWIQDDEDEAMLRRAIDAEKPAHTQYDLCLVEPRLQVGVQSTVGFDSILGDYSELRLACAHGTAARRLPRQRLGIDTVLAKAPNDGIGLPLGTKSRVGIETTLT